MLYRVTSQTRTNQAIRFVSQYNSNIVDFQRQISSGVRIHRASDDPIAFRDATSLTTRLQQLDTESYAIVDAESKLNNSVSHIQQAHDLLVKAKTLAQQGVQATSESERNALAVEVDGLLASMKDISKAQVAGTFLYSGTRSEQQPFEFGSPLVPGGTMVADYQGSEGNSYALIGTSISIETLYAGDQVFGGVERQETLVLGSTGAASGAGTDSMIGRADLLVQHTLTTYAGASGVAPGTSSVGSDTVLGPSGTHSVTIVDTSGTGDFGTVKLNNGEEIPWARTDTDLKVVGDGQREVYLDMSSIAAGFNGAVSMTADGTMSVDGGATTVAIDFTSSQTLVDSVGGGQVHIDSQSITRTGTDHLEFTGTSNVFQALYELASDLRNTRGLDNEGYSQAVDRRLGELGLLADHTLVSLGQQSASLQTLQELDIRVQNLQLDAETQLNEVQATDVPEVVLRMQNEQALLEFTYSVTAQVTSTSLLDFLR